MKLVALQTIHGRELVTDRNPDDPKSRAKYRDLIARPGEAFDSKDFGLDADEIAALVAAKAVKRKTREVADDSEPRTAGAGESGKSA